jgi:predicted exporter
MVTEALRQDERQIRDNWGGAREAALLFAEGATLAEALERNDQVAATLAARLPDSDAISLAPLWPSARAQRANRSRWSRFVGAHGAKLASELTAMGANYGFSRQAFAPFRRFLRQEPPRLDEESLAEAGLESLLALFHVQQGGRHYFLTMLPDTPRLRDLALAGALPIGVSLVSTPRLGAMLGQAISRDFVMFVAVACGSMFLLLCLLFRKAGFALLAMVPLSCGLAGVLLMLRCSGGSFNLFTVAALPLVIGLGADYGIFMVCRARSGQDHGTSRAVLVSGLTTVVGFGALVMARHPALHTLGLTVLVGVGVAIPAALLLVPALYRRAP